MAHVGANSRFLIENDGKGKGPICLARHMPMVGMHATRQGNIHAGGFQSHAPDVPVLAQPVLS